VKNELLERLRSLQRRMDTEELDCYVISSEENIWYLTDITYKPEERPFFIVVPVNENPILLVPKMEEIHLRKVKIDCEIKSYWEYPSPEYSNWYDVLQNIIKRFKRVGTETHVKSDILNKIYANEIVLVDLVDEMRKVKSPFELELIKNTSQICDKAIEKIFKNVYLGSTVVEAFSLSRTIQTELIRNKAFDPITTSLLTAVWPAPISSMPHSIPNLSDRINKGPNVAMSYLRINGYASECERTFFIGKPEKENEEHFLHMMSARNQALSILKVGVKCSDVDIKAKNYLVKKGYGEHLLHRTGHGIGMRNHEGPWIAEGNDEILRENMVISIEPGIYIEGLGGYRHSDTIRVTRDGYELLTKSPVEIRDVSILSSNIIPKVKGKIIQNTLKL
jgi:Xaa-Pro aminopeptidase